MTLAELCAKWEARRLEWQALSVHVDGERLATEVLADLRTLVQDDAVTLQEASLIGGYSVEHLARLIAQGKLADAGRKYARRVRRSDVPVKPGHGAAPLPNAPSDDQLGTRRRIVADVQTQRGA